MDDRQTYLLAGGGSGGHLFPGIAVADEVRRRNPRAKIVFVGSERPVERQILACTPYVHHRLPVESLRELRRWPPRFFWRNWQALQTSRRILNTEKPQWVIGLGGFVSVPTVWMASRLGIPVLLMEQNVIPGTATRCLARFASQICLSFEETRPRLPAGLPAVITGNPVRQEIVEAAEQKRERIGNSDHSRRTLLILGGSQGAATLNDAVVRWIESQPSLFRSWQIVHQTGPDRSAEIRRKYATLGMTAVVDDFFPNVAEWYVQADLVISRAGATTLAELACVGCPSILVPYPFAADQHQAANADSFSQQGAALHIPQAVTVAETACRLKTAFESLQNPSQRLDQMRQAALQLARPNAAKNIVNSLLPIHDGPTFRCDASDSPAPISRPIQPQELLS